VNYRADQPNNEPGRRIELLSPDYKAGRATSRGCSFVAVDACELLFYCRLVTTGATRSPLLRA